MTSEQVLHNIYEGVREMENMKTINTMSLTYKDLETLIEKANMNRRDLRLAFNADGSIEVDYTYPYRITNTTEVDT